MNYLHSEMPIDMIIVNVANSKLSKDFFAKRGYGPCWSPRLTKLLTFQNWPYNQIVMFTTEKLSIVGHFYLEDMLIQCFNRCYSRVLNVKKDEFGQTTHILCQWKFYPPLFATWFEMHKLKLHENYDIQYP
jgi:hypothetical protein